MQQPSLFPQVSLSVSDLTRYLREWMESDELLRDVWITGEISNLSRPASGHIYFTLKDQNSALKCVIWRMSAGRIGVSMQSGMAIEAHGYVSVYERDGQYQLYVDAVRPAGEGYLYQEFLRLKARLEAEGLFETERKRPIPEVPARIGIVTSPTGAALQDMLNTLRRRYPLAEVVISPAAVQGEEAPAEIAAAIERLNREPGIEVILLARGGGSLEDLWSFNDERVVRAVVNSDIPVISGVGHETDFTLADFAADLRAPTPTAAAELASPDIMDVRERLVAMATQLNNTLSGISAAERLRLSAASSALLRVSPMNQVRSDRQRLDELTGRITLAIEHSLQISRMRTVNLHNRLGSLNPFAVLKRGYAIVTNAAGEIIHSVNQTAREDTLDVRIADGTLLTRVIADPIPDASGE